ncbi:MAG: glycosyltransferase [Sandaracinaceae bacterium]|nr:glycosyltransferase [Sandaracinaceae bacterium]
MVPEDLQYAPLWPRSRAEARVAVAVVAKLTDAPARASLRRALQSVASLTDACVVILDDRSHPDVDAELAALGAMVVRRRWTDDFAAARNAVHEYTEATWLLVIDSDEVLVDPGNLAVMIMRAEREGHDGVLCRVETVGDSGPGQTLPQIRIYRRETCRWRYPVHNELVGARSVVPSTATFLASYVGTIAEKAARSLPLLLAQVEADPEEPRWAHFLAQTYHAIGDTAEMVRWSERCVELAPDVETFVHRWCDLALARFVEPGRRGEGLETILEALRRHPSHPDPWHALATIALGAWYDAATRGQTLTPVRSARYASNLAGAATVLGLPIAPRVPGAPDVDVAAPTRVEPRAPGRLRVAFIEQHGIGDGRFLESIVSGLAERFDVRHVETLSLREVGEAAAWADVVWLEWAHELTAQASRRVPLLRDKPVLCRIHGFEVFTDLPARVDWSVVDRVVFVARHKRDVLLASQPDLAPRSVVLRNGVSLDRFTVAPKKANTRHLVAVGHLSYRKGYCMLLQFFNELRRRDGRFRLSIRGDPQDARYVMALHTMIDELELDDHVELVTERVPDLNAWFADKSHILSFSLEESFHMSLGEGMAAGLKPIIHAWREAREIWPEELVFRDLDGFLRLTLDDDFEPERYRACLAERGLHEARQVDEVERLIAELLPLAP